MEGDGCNIKLHIRRIWPNFIITSFVFYIVLLARLYGRQSEGIEPRAQEKNIPNKLSARIEDGTSGITRDLAQTAAAPAAFQKMHQASSNYDRFVDGYNEIGTETRRLEENEKSFSSDYLYEPVINCNEKKTYIIYVYSARNRTDRRQLIRNTWGRLNIYRNLTVNIQLFFVLGKSDDDVTNPDLDVKLETEAQRYGDILMYNFMDTYNNLTLKGLAALKWINSTCDANNLEFIFKTDDDVYVNIWKVLALAKNATETDSHFAGVCKSESSVQRSGKWAISEDEYPNNTYPEYCSGGGYGMTRKGFLLLMDSLDKVPIFPIEDTFFTSLAVRWAHPHVNITYYSVTFKRAKMLLTRSSIDKIIKYKTKLERFILGHPVPADVWRKLHKAVTQLSARS